MELRSCEECVSMTNHDEKTGECLRCRAKNKASSPKPEEAHADEQISSVVKNIKKS